MSLRGSVSPLKPGTGEAEPETEVYATQSEAAFVALRNDILSASFSPGEKLLLDRLRERYGFGSSPLREALSRLAADRLVIGQGQRGYWVASTSAAEFHDITDIRLSLEPMALERSIANATLDWEARLAAAFHRLQRVELRLDTDPARLSGDWEKENRAFHLALIDNCGSAWLMHFVQALSEHSERYRRQAVALQAVPKERLQREHREIFEAALGRNGRLAAELLKVHIRNAAASLESVIFGDNAP